MRHASLFSGIGGFDLAAEWVGWSNVFNCEIEPYCKDLLKQHFPDAEQIGDITKTDFTKWCGSVDIVSGGFPCQPFSQAGEQRGTEDDRHLWPEMFRVIKEIQPAFVVGENVQRFATWNDGMVFDQALSDLESAGYEVWSGVLPACSVEAPHGRNRVWIVAYSPSIGLSRWGRQECDFQGWGVSGASKIGPSLRSVSARRDRQRPDTDSEIKNDRRAFDQSPERQKREFRKNFIPNFDGFRDWEDLPKPGISRGDDGLSNRMDRVKGLGNAVVPQQVYVFFKAIDEWVKG